MSGALSNLHDSLQQAQKVARLVKQDPLAGARDFIEMKQFPTMEQIESAYKAVRKIPVIGEMVGDLAEDAAAFAEDMISPELKTAFDVGKLGYDAIKGQASLGDVANIAKDALSPEVRLAFDTVKGMYDVGKNVYKIGGKLAKFTWDFVHDDPTFRPLEFVERAPPGTVDRDHMVQMLLQMLQQQGYNINQLQAGGFINTLNTAAERFIPSILDDIDRMYGGREPMDKMYKYTIPSDEFRPSYTQGDQSKRYVIHPQGEDPMEIEYKSHEPLDHLFDVTGNVHYTGHAHDPSGMPVPYVSMSMGTQHANADLLGSGSQHYGSTQTFEKNPVTSVKSANEMYTHSAHSGKFAAF